MEQDNSKVAWGKALKPIFALLLVIVLWQGACIGNVKEWNHQHVDCSCAGKCGQCCDFWDRILGCEITAEPVSYNSQGKTEDEQEQTKIGEKAKKLMEREDDIGLMMRSVHDSISSFATVISGIKTATEELKSVSDDFNNYLS